MATGKFVGSCDPTIEELFRIQIQLDKNNDCSIDILDTAEMEEFIPLRENPIDEGSCLVIGYNLCEANSPNKTVEKYLKRFEHKQVTVIIVGLKGDLRDNFENDNTNFDYIINLCKQKNICYVETSAKDNINIQFLFQFAVYNIWFDSFKD
ncbi:hypothetical protein RFI_16048 [Reticulomyxa filosa]|uniref:Uncharacterized protein n=1 Tax=Reticulomyxa filosa TaxID=46433 RepID=X6N768_RETFI|nr:hypothetical protein RFI_16048 [Reticulomyxa filosa]|eukprot:ETO21157.1 hypothetical protein RFI_16048 [Reticulomyxa filosa]